MFENESFALKEDMIQFLNDERSRAQCESQLAPTDGSSYCPAIYDGLLCWNHTRSGHIAHQHCPSKLDFNTSAFAFKTCLASGEWLTKLPNQTYTDYMACVPKASYTIYIYFVGYSLSIVALVISLAMLFYFKQLSCHRITLHKNLFFCNLINSTGWLVYFSVLALHSAEPMVQTICQLLYLLVNYTGTATYFWMLSEGLYLLMILIFTFNKGKLLIRFCIALGWGAPLVLIALFGGLRYSNGAANLCQLDGFNNLMYIMLVPIFVTIILNILFMATILAILFNKLRSQPNIEQHQGHKAAKAILILTPVMGVHSLLLLVQPDDQIWLRVHNYVSALTNSLQGFMIAMPFCFFSNEIHEAIRLRRRRQLQCSKAPRSTNHRNHKACRSRTPQSSIALGRSIE